MRSGTVFITGGTGYIGRALIPKLLERGFDVRALVRQQSVSKLPCGCRPVIGNPLDATTFTTAVPGGATFLQLVGVPHPSPRKAKLFREVDLVSLRESVRASCAADIGHFIYLSVAQPAPMMREYIAVRAEGEAMVRSSGLRATILRPWYVLGPAHRWPYILLPFYWLCERLPASRPTARRLGLVTLGQMVAALVLAAEELPSGPVRVIEVPEIRAAQLRQRAGTN